MELLKWDVSGDTLTLGSGTYQQKWIFAKARAQCLPSTLHFSCCSLLRASSSYPPVPPAEGTLAPRLHAPEAQLPLQVDLKGILLVCLTPYIARQITGALDSAIIFLILIPDLLMSPQAWHIQVRTDTSTCCHVRMHCSFLFWLVNTPVLVAVQSRTLTAPH